MPGETLRLLPSIESALSTTAAMRLSKDLNRELVRDLLREIIEQLRQQLSADKSSVDAQSIGQEIERRLLERAKSLLSGSLRRVVNATGVIIHTNLGRAPLAQAAVTAVANIAAGYSNLEYDLGRGERGHRESHSSELIERLCGSESAIVANNNAAAVLLVLNTLAKEEKS